MKLGIHLSSYTEQWNDTGLEYIPHAAKTGYQGVELPLMEPYSYDVGRAKTLLKEYGLSCTCGTGVNVKEDPSSSDSGIRKKGVERLKRCVEICSELESDCLGGVLYTPWMAPKNRKSAGDSYKWAAESLRAAGSYAQEHGVILALEMLNRYEGSLLNKVEEGIHFLELAGEKNVMLHYDTYHAYIEESDPCKAILLGGEKIGHVHLCDNNRGAPGTGNVNWAGVKKALTEIGYTRWAMVENFVVPDCQVGDDVCIWSGTGVDKYTNAEMAFSFVSNLWSRDN